VIFPKVGCVKDFSQKQNHPSPPEGEQGIRCGIGTDETARGWCDLRAWIFVGILEMVDAAGDRREDAHGIPLLEGS
jgi:hypothetical protein